MSTQGPLRGGGANNSSVGDYAWLFPTRINAQDSSFASVELQMGFASYYLQANGFGFTIPSGATIEGIVVTASVKCDFGAVRDYQVRIRKGGVIGSTEGKLLTYWPTSATDRTWGSSSDLWGETWDDSSINSAAFGVEISCTADDYDLAYVDDVRITVYYTTGGGGYTLSVTSASVTVTPTAAALLAARRLAVSEATVTVTPTLVTFRHPYRLALDPATVSVTPTSGAFLASRRLGLDPATVAVTMTPAGIYRLAPLVLDPATVTVTPTVFTLRRSRRLALDPATVTVTLHPVSYRPHISTIRDALDFAYRILDQIDL